MGDRYFDLANFAVNNELDEAQQAELLERLLRRAAATSGGSATLRLMRFMSDFREAMWGVVAGASSRSSSSTSPATQRSTSIACARPGPTRASPPGSRRRVAARD